MVVLPREWSSNDIFVMFYSLILNTYFLNSLIPSKQISNIDKLTKRCWTVPSLFVFGPRLDNWDQFTYNHSGSDSLKVSFLVAPLNNDQDGLPRALPFLMLST